MTHELRALLGKLPLAEKLLKKMWLQKKILLRRWEGEKALHQTFRKVHGRPLDLTRPVGFSEKLFRRMILMNRARRTEYTELADKYLARDYVAEKIGERYLTRIYWCGADPREIPFDSLPERYVVKTNHGSGQVIAVQGQADRRTIIARVDEWLRSNYYWKGREYQYFNIQPRVFAEEFLDDGMDGGPLDYRFWCFNGAPEVIQVDNHRHDINPFFDVQWRLLDLHYRTSAARPQIERPRNLDEMLTVARVLAADFDFVRVDLYNVAGRICFGELTFTPVAGQFRFLPAEWDLRLGGKWSSQTR